MILYRLDKVRRSGNGRWVARCPAHEDRSPSLSVKECLDGHTLIHCFAGCDYKDILAAIGLGPLDLYPELSRTKTGRAAQQLSRRVSPESLEERELMLKYGVSREVAIAMITYRLSQEVSA